MLRRVALHTSLTRSLAASRAAADATGRGAGANILINSKGDLKLADFGLSRKLDSQDNKYTPKVCTLWYRPPELLLGERMYAGVVDMWSVGYVLESVHTLSLARP